MAPEQVRCDSAAVGRATDVWALGVILYELLTRRRPFEAPTEAALLKQICEADPTSPRKLRSDLPRGLETVCLKCLEERPGDRYRSPSELANDLQRILEKVDPLGRRPPLWRRVGNRAKRYPVRSALLGVLLGVAALALPVVSWNLNFVRQKNIEGLFQEVKAAQIEDVARLVSRFDELRDADAIDRLGLLFETGRPIPQLIAAAVLAPRRPDCRQFCYDRLLDAEPREIAPVARSLGRMMPDLGRRLEVEFDAAPPTDRGIKEASDLRRANVACTLAILGSDERALALLQSNHDPQARTFLIHSLGPAGVSPSRLVGHMEDPRTDESVRIALIQSLGSVPDPAWGPALRARVRRWLLERYRDDPHAGVHGSVKWLLHHWKLRAELERIDRGLAGKPPPDPSFQWRISQQGLTLITVDDPELDRVIEVSDTEITVAQFRKFNQTRPADQQSFSSPEISSEDSCPVNGVSYFDAAAFCNWLNGPELLSGDEVCYRRTGWYEYVQRGARKKQAVHEPALDRYDRGGFRLPTSQEFGVFCRAGTITRRYHGNSDSLFDRYAWTLLNTDGSTRPVASLIPNDFGLFDTLGNIWEWCDSAEPHGDAGVVGDLQGGFSGFGPVKELDRSTGISRVLGGPRDPVHGFRVVRTKKVR
jgi:hypothetical protein